MENLFKLIKASIINNEVIYSEELVESIILDGGIPNDKNFDFLFTKEILKSYDLPEEQIAAWYNNVKTKYTFSINVHEIKEMDLMNDPVLAMKSTITHKQLLMNNYVIGEWLVQVDGEYDENNEWMSDQVIAYHEPDSYLSDLSDLSPLRIFLDCANLLEEAESFVEIPAPDKKND